MLVVHSYNQIQNWLSDVLTKGHMFIGYGHNKSCWNLFCCNKNHYNFGINSNTMSHKSRVADATSKLKNLLRERESCQSSATYDLWLKA